MENKQTGGPPDWMEFISMLVYIASGIVAIMAVYSVVEFARRFVWR